jgi:capsular polysaccharide biosynthesis protein
MSEQSVDLRSTLAVVRRNIVTISIVGVVGLAAGGVFALVHPPEYSSSALVLMPVQKDASGQASAADIDTDMKVATSDVVLEPAGSSLQPQMSAGELGTYVSVSAATADVMEIRASGSTAAQARQRAQAVAEAEVAYTEQSQSSLSNAQRAALAGREQTLQSNLDTVNREIEQAKSRISKEDPASPEGRGDATALAQLGAQQADLSLQIDRLKDQEQPDGTIPTAHIIQNAVPATRPGIAPHFILFYFIGLVLSVLLATIVLTVLDRRDRRVRYRDEMADALGSAVVASVSSRVPRTVAGWASVLQSYQPGIQDAWALRQVLREVTGPHGGSQPVDKPGKPTKATAAKRGRAGATVLVIALSDDLRGVAVGAQLASYAASVGIRTRLYAAQRHESAAGLWAACHRGQGQEELRPGLFVDTGATSVRDPQLTVVLAVLDRRNPEVSVSTDVTRALFAVSSGAVTAEDIARAAVAADDAGCVLSGLIVADPDDLDRTTGRMLQHERSRQVVLPARVTGVSNLPPGGPGQVRRPS